MREVVFSSGGRVVGILLVCIALGMLGAALLSSRNAWFLPRLKDAIKPPGNPQSAAVYYCPMHPQVRSDRPGTCPICNMDLEKLEPGLDAPKTETGEEQPLERVHISPRKQQLIGVRLSSVKEGPLSSTIRAVGRLTYDETRISRIQTKIEGWIEEVFINYAGSPVKKNQLLVSIYSPQVFPAQQELLIAGKSRDALAGSPFPGVAADARSLHEAARLRLRLWEIPDSVIRKVEKMGQPLRAMPVHSPMDGFVLTRNAYPGQRITPETELYTLADLSTIWVLAEVYECEIPMGQQGQPVSVTIPRQPGRSYTGKVAYVYPELDKVTRTLRVRLEFPNPDLHLKPEMYADVEILVSHGPHLSVPAEAVMDSGTEQRVFVALEEGYFEPRKVRTGATVGDRTIILAVSNPERMLSRRAISSSIRKAVSRRLSGASEESPLRAVVGTDPHRSRVQTQRSQPAKPITRKRIPCRMVLEGAISLVRPEKRQGTRGRAET